jgi:hypothetical protein
MTGFSSSCRLFAAAVIASHFLVAAPMLAQAGAGFRGLEERIVTLFKENRSAMVRVKNRSGSGSSITTSPTAPMCWGLTIAPTSPS